MRIQIKLPSACPVADRDCLASIVVELATESPSGEKRERDLGVPRDHACDSMAAKPARPAIVSVRLGGPHDEQVRRDIAEGEHIFEDPAVDPIGFYGLTGINGENGPIVQFYRWIEVGRDVQSPGGT
jgi:hypothetical protein